MITRPIQGSLLPELRPERPVGPLPASVQTGSNADLIARIAPLYLDGRSVMDVTYGRGRWWTRWRPDDLICHDIDPAKGDGVDFRRLPEADDSVDVVCFDPPYLPQGSDDTSSAQQFLHNYGLDRSTRAELWELMTAGLAECGRVSRQFVLAKCCDFTNGGSFHLGHVKMIEAGEAAGMAVHDLYVHHTGSGPGGHQINDIQRARRHHSYLVVFTHNRWSPFGTATPGS